MRLPSPNHSAHFAKQTLTVSVQFVPSLPFSRSSKSVGERAEARQQLPHVRAASCRPLAASPHTSHVLSGAAERCAPTT